MGVPARVLVAVSVLALLSAAAVRPAAAHRGTHCVERRASADLPMRARVDDPDWGRVSWRVRPWILTWDRCTDGPGGIRMRVPAATREIHEKGGELEVEASYQLTGSDSWHRLPSTGVGGCEEPPDGECWWGTIFGFNKPRVRTEDPNRISRIEVRTSLLAPDAGGWRRVAQRRAYCVMSTGVCTVGEG